MDRQQLLIEFFEADTIWKPGVNILRELALTTEVSETYKWQFPTYTIGGKNVIALASFKEWFGIWFFQGALLSDPLKVLTNAQEGKTKAMRHWKFDSNDSLPLEDILAYMDEAIANQKAGKVVKSAKPKPVNKSYTLPDLLITAFANDKELQAKFYSLSPARQRNHANYINEAKQENTKLTRLEKIIPLILKGRPIEDLYTKK